MIKQSWSEDYKITSFLIHFQGRAGLYEILNLIQDIGWVHAQKMNIQLEKNQVWVFTRQKLVMDRWPAWNEVVILSTWVRPPAYDFFLLRDYEIFCGNEKIGECTSTFTVMDAIARKLVPVDWSSFPLIWQSEGHLNQRPERITFASELADLAEFRVRNSDIDLNRHVNNTKYAQWILDAVPIDFLHSNRVLREYEVNFLAETKIGDDIIIQWNKDEAKDESQSILIFQGLRKADHKPVFIAKLKIESESQELS